MPEMLELLENQVDSLVDATLETAVSAIEAGIERRGNLPRREFEREYSLPRRPVILTDATRDWEARRWTPTLLKAKVGHREIEFRGGRGKIRFDELTDQIEASTDGSPAPYGRNINVFRDLPELAADIRPRIAYCVPDWKSSRLLPKDWVFANGLEEIFYGGQGTKFPGVHVDYWGMDAFLSQLYGEKEVLVFGPDQSSRLYPLAENPLVSSICDLAQPDLDRFPMFAYAQPIRVTLRPGETLFCPNGWWHTTSMPDVSITVVTANWGRGNWHLLINEYRRHHANSPRLKTLAVASYLRAIGAALTVRDLALLGL